MLIDKLAMGLEQHDKAHEIVLRECGIEIGRFQTIADTKHYMQHTYGEGQPLEWIREQDTNGRRLVHEGFSISVERKLT